MNVSLTPQLEKFINDKVASGLYNSASEVVRDALRLLEERDRLRDVRLGELRSEIAVGLEQIEQGKHKALETEEDWEKFFEQIKQRGRQLLKQSTDGRTHEVA